MSFSIRYLPAVLLVVVSLPAALWAQSPAKQTTKAPRGSISGRITIKEKGAPGVAVSLRRSDNFTPYGPYQRATTDPDGFYRITNVASGSYEVSPSAPAFVMANVKDNAKSKTVLVNDDENVDNINFALVRGGVITGRVTDADGRPVIQQEVQIYQANAFDRVTPQQQPVFRTSSGQTDDRGIYRIFGLPAGRYKVASGRSEDSFGVYGPSRYSYKQVFHPDAGDQTKATVIEVGEGTEANNVDITLGRALQTFTATGRVVDATGQPIPNIRFAIQRSMGPRTEFVNAQPMSNALGEFIVDGLLPGKYSIYLFPNTSGGMRAEAVSFDILDQDVSGIIIKLLKGASISGTVILETEDKSVLQTLSQLQLRGYVMGPAAGSGLASSSASAIAADGSFTLSGLSGGTVNFTLGGTMTPFPPKGMNIARIEREGVGMTRTLEIKDGENVTGVRVVVSYGTGVIRGAVKIENGTLPDGARIFLRVSKGGEMAPTIRPPQVDARGQFLIDGLVAGTYEITAAFAGYNGKREVNVQDGIVTDVVITIDMSAPPVRPPPPVIRP